MNKQNTLYTIQQRIATLNSRNCILVDRKYFLIELYSYLIHFVKILEDNRLYYYINVSQRPHLLILLYF